MYSADRLGRLFTPATTDGGFADPISGRLRAVWHREHRWRLFVTYAQQNAAKHDDVAGQATALWMFSIPTAICCAGLPAAVAQFTWVSPRFVRVWRLSGRILIGNFGNGRINAFDDNGRFIDELDDAHGKPLAIDGLWTLTLGGGRGSSSDTLYFTAGPNDESDGLFGNIVPRTNSRLTAQHRSRRARAPLRAAPLHVGKRYAARARHFSSVNGAGVLVRGAVTLVSQLSTAARRASESAELAAPGTRST